eukprot:TRINITY_DN10571_c0_g1_i1.p1 TRINITY_DN10571_c0_g1~~TRINITY_DN10571_c0_g1_i1.p1  ORF type:complete len:127 (-),score=23.57 TRINITY_DN10571_c0_g1_i1:453-833(-)
MYKCAVGAVTRAAMPPKKGGLQYLQIRAKIGAYCATETPNGSQSMSESQSNSQSGSSFSTSSRSSAEAAGPKGSQSVAEFIKRADVQAQLAKLKDKRKEVVEKAQEESAAEKRAAALKALPRILSL